MITLKGLWLSLADDLEQVIVFEHLMSATITPESETSLIELAGGRIAARSRPTFRRQYSATVRTYKPHLQQQVEAWVGRIVLVRDGRGNKMYGIYRQAPIVPHEGNVPGFDLQFTLDEVSWSEAYDPEDG
jgi:hypothetical protein